MRPPYECEHGRLRAQCEKCAVASLTAEVERLRAERDAFYMDYRMKCDEETKKLHTELERLRAYVGTEMLRSDFQTAGHMRAELDILRAENAKLKALLREAAETAEYAAHQLEKARIWGGMEWHYNPLHPLHYRSAIERLRDMLPRIRAALGGGK